MHNWPRRVLALFNGSYVNRVASYHNLDPVHHGTCSACTQDLQKTTFFSSSHFFSLFQAEDGSIGAAANWFRAHPLEGITAVLWAGSMRGNDMLIHSNLDECFFFRCLDKEKRIKRKRGCSCEYWLFWRLHWFSAAETSHRCLGMIFLHLCGVYHNYVLFNKVRVTNSSVQRETENTAKKCQKKNSLSLPILKKRELWCTLFHCRAPSFYPPAAFHATVATRNASLLNITFWQIPRNSNILKV